jgi:hypothetical protein
LYATRDARSSLAVRAADRYDHRRRDPWPCYLISSTGNKI